MDATTIAVVAAAIVLWAAASRRLSAVDVTGPMALLVLGALTSAVGGLDFQRDDAPLSLIAQSALCLLLFSDAARVDVSRLRHDVALPARMLGIGLPLTIALGTVVAYLLAPGAGWGVALAVAACLAPTDAGLGAVIVNDPSVPRRIRRTLNVESGLNDGIAAPVVTLAIALVLESELRAGDLVVDALEELGLSLLIGAFTGVVGGALLRLAQRKGWTQPDAVPLASLGLAVLAATGAVAAGGNPFIGAFVAGLAFGPAARVLQEQAGTPGGAPLELTELGGQLLGSVVWFFFGVALFGPVLANLTWRGALYAVLSLTVVRMAPIALSLAGARLRGPTIAFLGWFGPRGLASLVFSLEVLDAVGSDGQAVFDVVGFTVLVSVVVHGATARPLADRYAAWSSRSPAEAGAATEASEPRGRHWFPHHRTPS